MIYVNGRFLLQNLTGVNRFAYELCRGANGDTFHIVLSTRSHQGMLRRFPF